MTCENFRMPFGKHKGDTLAEVLERNPGYLDWLHNEALINNSALAEAVEEMNEKYTEQIEAGVRFRRSERY